MLPGNILIEADYQRVVRNLAYTVELVGYSVTKEYERPDPDTGSYIEEVAKPALYFAPEADEMMGEARDELGMLD